MDQGRTVVIGAGPAGLAAAYSLAKSGCPVTVLEASGVPGGLSRTIEMFGQRVDLGPHRFFSPDPVINDFWLEVVGDEYGIVDRLTRIYYKNRYFHYPLRPWNVLWNLGPLHTSLALGSYVAAQLRPVADPHTFKGWVTRRFGGRLFQTFFQSYTEKVWGIPCHHIDADWAAQRIKGFSLKEAVLGALLPRSRGHATLVDRFAYPNGGTGTLYEKMARRIGEWGGEVVFHAPVARLLLDETGAVERVVTRNGRGYPCEHLISSMPLTLLVEGLPNAPEPVLAACRKLSFRNTILVYLEVGSPALFKDQWLYVHAEDVRVGRITNFRNWSPTLYGHHTSSILCMEYWCFDSDEIWRWPESRLVELAAGELRRLKLDRGFRIRNAATVKLRRSYPVYQRGYKEHLSVIRGHLDKIPNLDVIGRYGSFKYNNQDHSLLMGLLAADRVRAGTAHELWTVNCTSTYQEAARTSQVRLFSPERPDARQAA